MNIFEKRYYIMDEKGNFYNVGENDALIIEGNEGNAHQYDIIEANKRINASEYRKELRTILVKKNKITKNSYQSENEGEEPEFCMEEIDIAKFVRKLIFLQNNISKYMKQLSKKQSKVDEEICDILHFIELYQCEDGQEIELVKQLEDCRKRRRKIKDEYIKTEAILRVFTAGGMNNILKDISKVISNLEGREYNPRQLPQLFLNGAKQEKVEESICNYNDDFEEDNIMYERKETIFDGQKKDWLAFASEQAAFFENIKQYRVNLELDIEEIDNQLEELMMLLEDTNYNVTQGYKMYKQLKELRLSRKEKLNELDEVSVIVENFHCESMADTYRYCEDILMSTEPTEINDDMPKEEVEDIDDGVVIKMAVAR